MWLVVTARLQSEVEMGCSVEVMRFEEGGWAGLDLQPFAKP
jgi:hypothetical protein